MRKTVSSFVRANDGGIAVTFGLLLPMLILFMALGIDLSRTYYIKSRVQLGLDAASLAAAQLLDDPGATDADIQAKALAYFNLNVGLNTLNGVTISNFQATPDYDNHTVFATADVNVPTLLAKAGGSVASMTMKPSAQAMYKTTRLEVVLVLDNTGSMNDLASADGKPKLESLKTTAKAFIDVLYAHNPQSGFVRVALAPYSDALNAGSYANTVAGFGSDTCVVNRTGAAAYTDTPPSILTFLGRSSVPKFGGYVCPQAIVKPLTDLSDVNARNAFKASIDGMTANGSTAGHIGAAWGWYLVSPNWNWVFGSNAGLGYSSNVKKIVILLTDGIFNTAYGPGGTAIYFNPDGTLMPQATDPVAPQSSPYQALALCQNIKTAAPGDQAITIYTIGFDAPTDAEATLKTCSGSGNFYSASSASTLQQSFEKIAAELVNLKISS